MIKTLGDREFDNKILHIHTFIYSHIQNNTLENTSYRLM